MVNIFIGDDFYSELCEYLDEEEDIQEDNIANLPDDYKLEVFESSLERIVTLSYDWIVDRVNEERFPENNDRVDLEFSKAIEAIPFDTINELMPQLYYKKRKSIVLTKKDIIEYYKN